jgi:hypothetical protein
MWELCFSWAHAQIAADQKPRLAETLPAAAVIELESQRIPDQQYAFRLHACTLRRLRSEHILHNLFRIMPGGGVEPPRPDGRRILSPLRLPVPPSRPRLASN